MNFKQLIPFCGFVAMGLGLSMITHASPTPEKSTSLWMALPAFLIFILFCKGILSWGAFVRSRLNFKPFCGSEEGMIDLALGSVGAYLLAYALTALNLFQSDLTGILWGFLGLGYALGSSFVKPKKWFTFEGNLFFKVIAFLPLSIVLLKCLEGIQFPSHGDAYITYLAAPRTWAATGNFSLYQRFTEFFLSTSWEALFAWGTGLMALTGGSGLDVSQWFSQWVTAGVGILGIALTLDAFSKRLALDFPLSQKWFPLFTVSALQIPVLQWTQNLAKNDMGVGFWACSAFYFFMYLAPLSSAFVLFTGIIVGAATIGKLTLSILGICIGIGVLARTRKYFGWFVLGGLIGIAPVIIRNYVLTQNPLFPWLSSIFPNPNVGISASQGGAHATQMLLNPSNLWMYSKEILVQIPWLIALIPALFIKVERKKIIHWLGYPFLALIVFTLTFRASTEIRYQGPTLILLRFFSTYLAFYWIKNLAEKFATPLPWVKNTALAMLAILVMAISNITYFSFGQIGSSKKFAPWPKKFPTLPESGGEAKLWIRSHLDAKDPLLVVGDGYVYYLIDYSITQYGEKHELELPIAENHPDQALLKFKEAPYRFLYLANDADFAPYRPIIQAVMNLTQGWNQTCKLYSTDRAQVWDLDCVKKGAT